MSIHRGPDTATLCLARTLSAWTLSKNAAEGNCSEHHRSSLYLCKAPPHCPSWILSCDCPSFPPGCGMVCHGPDSSAPKLSPKLRRVWDQLKGKHFGFWADS